MTWWTLNYLSNTRSWTHLYTVAATTQPDHLFMAWAKHKPRRHAIWRVVRGQTVFCGWQYIWDTPNILQQMNPGDTNWHYFLIYQLEPDDHIWYYLFAPDGPYGLEIQGPLIHVPPPQTFLWASKLYVGTHLKGVYYTDTFTGPGGDHPTWTQINTGLHSLKVTQLEPDPLAPEFRQYCISGDPLTRRLYVRDPAISTAWTTLLTDAQAQTLAGSPSGSMTWISTNYFFPGHLYLLFNSGFGQTGTWCLRSTDYGTTWTAHQIYNGALNYSSGNIMPSLAQGSSPYDPGTVLYASTNSYLLARTCLWRSLNHGQSWTLIVRTGAGILTPRHLVDPVEPLMPYFGLYINVANPHELYRYTPDPPAITEVDGIYHLGPIINPIGALPWVNPTDQDALTVLAANHIFTTTDYCLTWNDWGLIDQPTARLAILWENPSRLYLGKHTSATFPPLGPQNHVIYVSDDHGTHMEGKAGQHAWAVDGGGDSIPYNCGGICLQGMILLPPY